MLNDVRYFGVIVALLVAIILFIHANDDSAINVISTDPYKLIYPAYFGNRITIPEDNPTTRQGVYLGRMLFYETKLSSTNKISCATCHQQKFAFSDNHPFSTGVGKNSTSRNSMSLANLLWVRSFFWDGRTKSLEEQVTVPLTHPDEMGESLENVAHKLQRMKEYPPLFKATFGTKKITGDRIVKALSQFERTLISSNAPYDKYLRGDYRPTKEELHGLELFMTNPVPRDGIRGGNCGFCHGTPKLLMELFHNNGLDTVPKDIGREKLTGLPADRGRFRVATLRNIAVTSPYMHDGRFNTLEEVLDHYNEHIQQSPSLSQFLQNKSNEPGGKRLRLTTKEKEDIILFLKMLTDSTFLTTPAFADPHITASNDHLKTINDHHE